MPYILNEPFSLNTLHKRAGGSSETTCSLNDTDIRALRHTATGGSATESSFEQFAVSAVHTFTVTAVDSGTFKGYLDDGSTTVGSISPDPPTVNSIYAGWKIESLVKFDGTNVEPITLKLSEVSSGASASDSGWEHLKIGDTHFYRYEADSYGEAGGATTMTWQWYADPDGGADTVGPNPFNMSGTTAVKIG